MAEPTDIADDAQIAAARATGEAGMQDCERVEIVDSGLGLQWPAIGEDWYVPGVIEALTIRHAA